MRGEGTELNRGSEFEAAYSCSSSTGADMGLPPFEWLMFALLLLSLPVVYIRKQGGLDAIWVLLPVYHPP